MWEKLGRMLCARSGAGHVVGRSCVSGQGQETAACVDATQLSASEAIVLTA